MMYDIVDHHHAFRSEDSNYLDSNWFWERSDISKVCLNKLIDQFRIGREIDRNIYNGWIPIDYWIWSSKITLFYGIWTVAQDDQFIEQIHTWYLAVGSVLPDYCPSMMSTDELKDKNYGILQIERGLSPLRWMFLNDDIKSRYFLEQMKHRLNLDDLIHNELGLDSFSETNLLSYVLRKFIPTCNSYVLPNNL